MDFIPRFCSATHVSGEPKCVSGRHTDRHTHVDKDVHMHRVQHSTGACVSKEGIKEKRGVVGGWASGGVEGGCGLLGVMSLGSEWC